MNFTAETQRTPSFLNISLRSPRLGGKTNPRQTVHHLVDDYKFLYIWRDNSHHKDTKPFFLSFFEPWCLGGRMPLFDSGLAGIRGFGDKSLIKKSSNPPIPAKNASIW